MTGSGYNQHRFETDRPGDRWIGFVQATLQAGRQVRHLLAKVSSGWHLSDSELLLLWTCSQPTPAGHLEAELAGPLGLTSGQLSAALYDLRDRGLLSFQRLPDGDTRQPLAITPLGVVALQDITQALAPAAAAWDSQVTEQELGACVQLLRKLSAVPGSSGSCPRSPLSKIGRSAATLDSRRTRPKRGAA